jgi:hypothetical protein
LLDVFLSQFVTDVAQVEAKLTNVLETKLVTLSSVVAQQFHEAVLANTERLLHLHTTTADL